MKIIQALSVDVESVHHLLLDFNHVFTPAISTGLDLVTYARKLSKNGHFMLAQNDSGGGNFSGFIAYYLNPVGHFAYIPFIGVKPQCQHQGVGHQMLEHLVESLGTEYDKILLEVRKGNLKGYNFYVRNGFVEAEDRGEKLLMAKPLR